MENEKIAITEEEFNVFKNGKMPDMMFLSEIHKCISAPVKYAVEFGTNSNTSVIKSFCVNIMPVSIEDNIKLIFYFDKSLLTQLSYNQFVLMIKALNNTNSKVIKKFYDLKLMYDGIELTKIDYINIFKEIQYIVLRAVTDVIHDNYVFNSMNTLTDLAVIDDMKDSDATSAEIIETIKLKNLFANDIVGCINKALVRADASELIIDKYFNQLISVTTSKTNPYYSKVIDPKTTENDKVSFID